MAEASVQETRAVLLA